MQKTDSKLSEQIKIGNVTIKSKVVAAPLAGITDSVLRDLVRKFSANCLLTTEMISSEALNQNRKGFVTERSDTQTPVAYQISGHKPDLMVKAAKMLEEKADIIDINMGCPVNKVIKATDGCALMKNPELAAEIVKSVKEAVNVPVTCKFRLGTNSESINFVEFAVKMQEAGASAVCVHARTRAQMYSGKADYAAVAKLKGEIDIPYFINGDITTPEIARTALEISGADGVAVGRGILGNPELPGLIDEYLTTGQYSTKSTISKLEILKEHLINEINLRGEENGLKFFRKFYAYYIKGVKNASEFRYKLVTAEKHDEVLKILNELEF